MEALATLLISSVVTAVRDHALASAEDQAKLEANMLAAVQAIAGDRATTGAAHDARVADVIAAIEGARTEEPTDPAKPMK